VLEGGAEGERGDLRGGFFQDPCFAWLSGWLEPGARLLLAPPAEADSEGDLLFLPDADQTRRLWTGPAWDASTQGAAASTGFGDVRRMAHWEETLRRLAGRYERIYCLPSSDMAARLRQAFPFREILSAELLLANGRMYKSEAEIQAIRDAIAITAAGQQRAWRSLQKSQFEYEVAADLTHEFLRRGAERHAFAPIVASGANACALHYSRNRAALAADALTIVDIGAERAGYCGDLTRTIPVGGVFSVRQSDLYQAVLEVQKRVIAAVRPGAYLGRQIPDSIHHLAVALLDSLPLGEGGKPLSAHFPHGIGHHLGMEVHDAHDPACALQPGMVVTIEPGVYLPREGIGIRIEDNVLVTLDGCEVLSAALPKEMQEIEEACRL
jgi:Xaa-Pro aminopeptidase